MVQSDWLRKHLWALSNYVAFKLIRKYEFVCCFFLTEPNFFFFPVEARVSFFLIFLVKLYRLSLSIQQFVFVPDDFISKVLRQKKNNRNSSAALSTVICLSYAIKAGIAPPPTPRNEEI